ncbi:GNAT family N-acetyltransferase [Pseudoroseomonas cervicalis]|uniref:GNAT family N-acetyltransferase n=1 Tax=Teichococcus cervicalis TaxID=204525 RepID=UPI002787DA4A|nr:GNAT family N-acetyltransferase [Pseudoroseomonas cervicalis]MDQ1080717.1 GNAT superfamily N-acetyltransferase [Pseudoroseomonas cervicalis]
MAAPADRALLQDMLARYRTEMGEPPDDPWLDSYWAEAGRLPFLLCEGRAVAGFALVNRWSCLGLPLDHAMAEFYVAPAHRRSGLGRWAARWLFAALPGQWEVAALPTALPFWRATVPSGATETPQPHALVLRFRTEGGVRGDPIPPAGVQGAAPPGRG